MKLMDARITKDVPKHTWIKVKTEKKTVLKKMKILGKNYCFIHMKRKATLEFCFFITFFACRMN